MLTVTSSDTTVQDSGIHEFTLTVTSPNWLAVNPGVYNFKLDLKNLCLKANFVSQKLPDIEVNSQDKTRVINQVFTAFMYDTLLTNKIDCGNVELILTVNKGQPPSWATLSAESKVITFAMQS